MLLTGTTPSETDTQESVMVTLVSTLNFVLN